MTLKGMWRRSAGVLNRPVRLKRPGSGHKCALVSEVGLVKLQKLARKIIYRDTDGIGPLSEFESVLSRITQGSRSSNHGLRLANAFGVSFKLGQVEVSSYDSAGNLSGKTDFNGKTTTFSYDEMRRLLSRTPDQSLGQPAVTFTYNNAGQRATMMDASGASVYSYDVRNRLTSRQTPFGTLTYTYDNAGNLATTRSSNTNGVSLDYTYDTVNRLSTLKDNRVIAPGGGVTNYSYDAAGNLESYVYPNTVTTSFAYNSLNRLTTVTVGTPATALASYSYNLGPAGNRTGVTELGGRTVTYTYDNLYRLTSESISNDPQGCPGRMGRRNKDWSNLMARNWRQCLGCAL